MQIMPSTYRVAKTSKWRKEQNSNARHLANGTLYFAISRNKGRTYCSYLFSANSYEVLESSVSIKEDEGEKTVLKLLNPVLRQIVERGHELGITIAIDEPPSQERALSDTALDSLRIDFRALMNKASKEYRGDETIIHKTAIIPLSGEMKDRLSASIEQRIKEELSMEEQKCPLITPTLTFSGIYTKCVEEERDGETIKVIGVRIPSGVIGVEFHGELKRKADLPVRGDHVIIQGELQDCPAKNADGRKVPRLRVVAGVMRIATRSA